MVGQSSRCVRTALVSLALAVVFVLAVRPSRCRGAGQRGGAQAQLRVLPDRRPGLDRPGLLRQQVLRDAEHRPAGPPGDAVHRRLRRVLCLFAHAGERPDRQVSGPAAPHRLDRRPQSPVRQAARCPTGPCTCRTRKSRWPRPSSRRGYATAAIGKWHLGGEAYTPETQGFDVNFGGDHRGQPPSYFWPYQIPEHSRRRDRRVPDRPADRRGREVHRDRTATSRSSSTSPTTPSTRRSRPSRS